MLTTILGIVRAAGSILAGILAYKNSANRQRRQAEADVRRKSEESRAKAEEIRAAVHGNDDERINQIVSTLLAVTLAFAVFGCTVRNKVVYVPSDRRIETCTNSIGIVCKAVPNAVFAELLERVQELKDLKTEMAVDKRLGK